MNRSISLFFLLFISSCWGASLCPGESCNQNACAGWRSLQQLRSLIPERIWEQDFSVVVDRKAFRKAICKWTYGKKEEWGPFSTSIAHTRCYFLRSTIAGSDVRILDRYQEFQGSPFWNNPPMMREMRSLEKQILKDNQ